MKHRFLCKLLGCLVAFVVLGGLFTDLWAIPNKANIESDKDGGQCFSSSEEAKITWNPSFKEDLPPEKWPTTWTAIAVKILINGQEVDGTIDAAGGAKVLTFQDVGKYKILVKVTYKADRTTMPLYDDHTFDKDFDITFVKVKSINGEKVVGLSGKLELEAESSEAGVWPVGQPVWSSDKGGAFDPPTGPNTTWTPSKSSEAVDDVTINTECGSSGETAHQVTVIEIKHQTKLEPNKDRTIIGVGEEVDLSIKPEGFSVDWELEGEGGDLGKLSIGTGDKTTYTSAKENRKVDVVAKHNSKKVESLGIETIEPTGALIEMSKLLGVGGKFPNGIITIGLDIKSEVYLLPGTVNFKNIEISEGVAEPIVTGYFNPNYQLLNHDATDAPVGMDSFVEGKGTKHKNGDHIKFVFDFNGEPIINGSISWNIPWYYHFDGVKKEFTKVEQKATLQKINATKYKYTLSKNATSLYYYINPMTGIRTSNVFGKDDKEVKP